MLASLLLFAAAVADEAPPAGAICTPTPTEVAPTPRRAPDRWSPGVTCTWFSYARPDGSCVDLFSCTDPQADRVWLQTRPPGASVWRPAIGGRDLPAPRIPAAGCDPSDLRCLDDARILAVQWACRP